MTMMQKLCLWCLIAGAAGQFLPAMAPPAAMAAKAVTGKALIAKAAAATGVASKTAVSNVAAAVAVAPFVGGVGATVENEAPLTDSQAQAPSMQQSPANLRAAFLFGVSLFAAASAAAWSMRRSSGATEGVAAALAFKATEMAEVSSVSWPVRKSMDYKNKPVHQALQEILRTDPGLLEKGVITLQKVLASPPPRFAAAAFAGVSGKTDFFDPLDMSAMKDDSLGIKENRTAEIQNGRAIMTSYFDTTVSTQTGKSNMKLNPAALGFIPLMIPDVAHATGGMEEALFYIFILTMTLLVIITAIFLREAPSV
jgi:hypothetical protein